MENQPQMPITKHKILHSEKEHELDHWSKKFGITHDEMREAVQAGGTSALAVEKYVKRLEHK